MLLKYARPHSSAKRSFLQRRSNSKDNLNIIEGKNFQKYNSPIKRKSLYETPVLLEKPKSLIKI